jgi:hypothetical protein
VIGTQVKTLALHVLAWLTSADCCRYAQTEIPFHESLPVDGHLSIFDIRVMPHCCCLLCCKALSSAAIHKKTCLAFAA